MITRSERALTEDERAVLLRLARNHGNVGNDVAGAGLVAVLVLLPAMWAIRLLDLPSTPWDTVALSLAAGLGVVTALYMRHQVRKLIPQREAYKQDLRVGMATVLTCDIVDAIQVDELEDEGSNYYLQLADSRVMFVSGQYLYEHEEKRLFPSTRLRRTLAPTSGLLLNFECLGDHLAPSAKRPAFTSEQHRRGQVPEDGAVLEIPFESLRHGAA